MTKEERIEFLRLTRNSLMSDDEKARIVRMTKGCMRNLMNRHNIFRDKECSGMRDGKMVTISKRGAIKIFWSGDMISLVKREFPTTDNSELASMLGVSVRSLTRKARELGVRKDKDWLHEVWTRNRNEAQRISRTSGNSGQFKKGVRNYPAGEFKNGQKPKKSVPCVQMDKDGKVIATFESFVDAAKSVGVNYRSIATACRRFGNSAGYAWRLKDYQ